MFSNYRPKIDYCDDYFSIKNLWDGGFFAGLLKRKLKETSV